MQGPEFPKSTSPTEPWLAHSCRERALKAIETRLAYQSSQHNLVLDHRET